MPKKCQYSGCNYNVFSNGFCGYHQRFRKDDKYIKSQENQRIKKISKIKNPSGLSDIFLEIWHNRPHKSQLSGRPLDYFFGTDFFVNIFAHLLAKGLNQYPKFKLYKKCIFLLHPDEHQIYDNGTKKQREEYAKKYNCDWSVIENLKNELIEEYKNLK